MKAKKRVADFGHANRRAGEIVATGRLAALARRYELTFKVENVVGEFIPTAHPIILYRRAEQPREAIEPRALERKIRRAFTIGMHRTIRQDVPFGVRQIVDIALKAISPAVNDPTTALNCIDHLGEILATLEQGNVHPLPVRAS